MPAIQHQLINLIQGLKFQPRLGEGPATAFILAAGTSAHVDILLDPPRIRQLEIESLRRIEGVPTGAVIEEFSYPAPEILRLTVIKGF